MLKYLNANLKVNWNFFLIFPVAKEDHSAHDCLMIAILSHGDTNIMYAKDYSYKPDLLWMSFTADKVPTLAGKPKIFFVQACQGNQLDEGTKLVKVNRTEVDSSPQSYRIPNHADFLIVYSTFPGKCFANSLQSKTDFKLG